MRISRLRLACCGGGAAWSTLTSKCRVSQGTASPGVLLPTSSAEKRHFYHSSQIAEKISTHITNAHPYLQTPSHWRRVRAIEWARGLAFPRLVVEFDV